MGCDEMKDLLALYAGSDVTDNERIAVEAHLGTCPECARELSEHREIRGLLAGMKEGEAPAGSIESIWPRVAAEIAPVRARRAGPVEWFARAAAARCRRSDSAPGRWATIRPAGRTRSRRSNSGSTSA